MAIFMITSQPGPNSEELAGAIANAVGSENTFPLGNSSWLVSAQGTAQDLSNRIGITEGHAGSAIVIEAASYYGRANPAIWSWIKANWEGAPLG